MDACDQLKKLSPFLDPHLFLYLLQKNIGPESQSLQDQIRSKMQVSDEAKSAELEKAAEEKAQKLLTLLSDRERVADLRKDSKFNFETLSKPDNGDITIEDCTNLFDFAKIQYDLQKYQKAENLLFNLKEILISQTKDHYHLVSQVFWGLLACMIILDKPRESTELSTIRKLKDMLKSRYAESPMGMLH